MHRPFAAQIPSRFLPVPISAAFALGLCAACASTASSTAGPSAASSSAAGPSAGVATQGSAGGNAPLEAKPDEWTVIPDGDPTKTEVSFAAGSGWEGTLVLDNKGVGVWTAAVMKLFQAYGCPEIVGLDDKGRCHVLWSYSGKWSPVTTLSDREWLGGIAQADLDPRVEGTELYVGGKSGNLYEIVAYPDAILDNRRIARLAGHEVHTLLAGELNPASPGPELIAFTLPGGIWELKPKAGADGFEAKLLKAMDGRVREAKLLPAPAGAPSEIAVIMRTGALEILTFTPEGPRFTPVFEIGMGMGRLALNGYAPFDRPVLYTGSDDGRVFRHERAADKSWRSEMVYAGPQGIRGLTWGRFDKDHSVETIAVFGYSHRVELLSRASGTGWKRETIFVDRDKGHWLTAGELDGRNDTDEIVCSGYSGRVVLLSRPPGYGLGKALAVDPLSASR